MPLSPDVFYERAAGLRSLAEREDNEELKKELSQLAERYAAMAKAREPKQTPAA